MKVLIVDDEPMARELLRHVYEAEGCEVTCAGSAPEALDLATDIQPDLVVTDVQMPGEFDGLEGVRRLRHDHDFQGVILIITGLSPAEVEGPATALGALYVRKPYSTRHLRQLFRERVCPSQP